MKKYKFLFTGLFFTIIFLSITSNAKGKSSDEKFKKPLVRFLPAMQQCRSSDNIQNISVTGKVVVNFNINDKGQLHKIKINESETTLNDLNIQKCVVDVIKKVKFPKAPKGKTISLNYPVIFK